MNDLPKVVTQLCEEQELNPRPVDRKSGALLVAPPHHLYTHSHTRTYHTYIMLQHVVIESPLINNNNNNVRLLNC